MDKPASLRKLLERVVPQVAADPSLLQMFTDKGKVAAIAGSLSFELRYTLSIVVQDFAGDPNQLFVPILAWVQQFQPELCARPDNEPFTFDAEIIDADKVDVEIALELSERIRVTTAPDGSWSTTVLPEPTIADGFGGACGATLWQLFLKDELIAETTDPDFHPPAP